MSNAGSLCWLVLVGAAHNLVAVVTKPWIRVQAEQGQRRKTLLLFTPRKTAWAIALVSAILVITTVLFLVKLQVRELFDPRTNVTFLSLEYETFEASTFSLRDLGIILISCTQIICLAGIVIANGMLIWGLKKKNQMLASRTAAQCSHNQRMTTNYRMRNAMSENYHQLSIHTAAIHELNVVSSPSSPGSSRPAPRNATRAARDRKLGRMAVILSGIQLISFIPTFVWTILAQIWPDLKAMER
ncbi:hypothetical protein PoB_003659400 [Plakobranchus ocellatus]|uniref:G-protein coupled receptors family 1 profile domain-containing protein n=1 Tax=Plakobranchus ocellatus TaxID=259542 RepID=A0AAV4AUU4_9GAST|nr:hypothetical protein PoB_003659400 [Plakobranchus ocellatus]